MLNQTSLVILGAAFVFCGFVVTFVALLLYFLKTMHARGKAKVRAGGLVMIGPIPIVFGTDKEIVRILLILSIVLIVLAVTMMLLPRLIS